MNRCVIYTRVSSEGQEDGTSLASQFAACSRKALELGMDVVAHFEEVETGVFYAGRTKLQSAIELLERGEAQALIFYTLDRFSRDREHQSAIKKRIERAGGKLIFCTQEFADNEEGDLMFGVTGSFAEYERKVIRRRCINGHNKLIEQGLTPSRTFRPYGYEIIKKNDPAGRTPGTFHIVENEKKIVILLFEKYASGQSLREIVKWLRDESIPTMKGGLWRSATVAAILKRSVYAGHYGYGKRKLHFDENRIGTGLNPKYNVPVNQSEWKYIDVPPIVSEEIWDLCQSRLQQNLRKGGRNDRKYMLTSLCFCNGCGKRMVGSSDKRQLKTKSTHKMERFYSCKYRDEFKMLCSYTPKCFDLETLEQRVIEIIIYTISNLQLVEKSYDTYLSKEKSKQPHSELDDLKKELQELKKREHALIESQVAAKIAGAESEIYNEMIAKTSQRRTVVKEKIAAMEIKLPGKEQVIKSLSQFSAEMLAGVEKVLSSKETPNNTKNQFVSAIISKVVPINKSKLQVQFHCAPPFILMADWEKGKICLNLEVI